MTEDVMVSRGRLAAGAAVLALASAALGYGVSQMSGDKEQPSASQGERKILYWYDPMQPAQHFDRPGKSPFMDMALVPKYADEAATAEPGVQIPTDRMERLGVRLATARRGPMAQSLTVTGTVDYNQRDIAIVQSRAAGFVQRVYARAPGDVIGAGAPLADVLVPEWGGAQSEYLAVRRAGSARLARAARERLLLLGMSPALVASVERSGRVRNVVSIATPTGGVIKTLGVRAGMTVAAGQTLAEVNGLSTVWLNAAVPEAVAGQARLGVPVRATFAAFPGEPFAGRVTAILPEAETASRTLTLRIELANRGLRLRPGMFATVELSNANREGLIVPSEAVIWTGRRTLVMLARPGGRFLPAEVQTGRESNGQTEILAGLSDGERVVASGQFLIDSEASLSGIEARPIAAASTPATPAGQRSTLNESVGRIETIERDAVTISHEPVPAIGWPAMTMRFRLAAPGLAKGLQRGQRVRFAFDQPAEGPTVRRISAEAGQ